MTIAPAAYDVSTNPIKTSAPGWVQGNISSVTVDTVRMASAWKQLQGLYDGQGIM